MNLLESIAVCFSTCMFVLVPPGIPGLITADMVKEGAAVIDIGR